MWFPTTLLPQKGLWNLQAPPGGVCCHRKASGEIGLHSLALVYVIRGSLHTTELWPLGVTLHSARRLHNMGSSLAAAGLKKAKGSTSGPTQRIQVSWGLQEQPTRQSLNSSFSSSPRAVQSCPRVSTLHIKWIQPNATALEMVSFQLTIQLGSVAVRLSG